MLTRHKAVFSDELGIIQGTSAKLHIDPKVFQAQRCSLLHEKEGGTGVRSTKNTSVDQPATFTDTDDPLMDPGVPPTQTDELPQETNDQYCNVLFATANHLTDLPVLAKYKNNAMLSKIH